MVSEKISGSPSYQSGKRKNDVPPTKNKSLVDGRYGRLCFWFFISKLMFLIDTCTGSHIIQSDFYSTKIIDFLF